MRVGDEVLIHFLEDYSEETSGGRMSWKQGDVEEGYITKIYEHGSLRVEVDWGCGQCLPLWTSAAPIKILSPLEHLADAAREDD